MVEKGAEMMSSERMKFIKTRTADDTILNWVRNKHLDLMKWVCKVFGHRRWKIDRCVINELEEAEFPDPHQSVHATAEWFCPRCGDSYHENFFTSVPAGMHPQVFLDLYVSHARNSRLQPWLDK